MSDKARSTFPINLSFNPGELPSDVKLNQIINMAKNGQKILETLIGDPWSQSGDTTMQKDPLQIPNIARVLGAYSKLAALRVTRQNSSYNIDITESTPSSGYVHRLQFTAKDYQAFSVPASTLYMDGNGTVVDPNGNFVTYPNQLVAGKYYFDSNSNTLHSFNEFDGTLNIQYTCLAADFTDELGKTVADLGGLTVYPPLDIVGGDAYAGLHWSYVDTGNTDVSKGFRVILPPITTVWKNKIASASSLNWPDSTISTNKGSGSSVAFYFDDSRPQINLGSGDEKWLFVVPPYITQTLGVASGGTIPDGLVFLYDENSKEFINGLQFKKDQGVDYSVIVTGDEDQLANIASTLGSSKLKNSLDPATATIQQTDFSAAYRLVFISTSVAEQIFYIKDLLATHKHTTADSQISHSSLGDLLSTGSFQDAPQVFYPSNWTNDDHTQYLHRYGYRSSPQRDVDSNALHGSLLIASTAESGSSRFINTDYDSHHIYFGSDQGPDLFYDQSLGRLKLDNKSLEITNNLVVGSGAGDSIYLGGAGALDPRIQYLNGDLTFKNRRVAIENGLYLATASYIEKNYQFSFDADNGSPGTYGIIYSSTWDRLYVERNLSMGEFRVKDLEIADASANNIAVFSYNGMSGAEVALDKGLQVTGDLSATNNLSASNDLVLGGDITTAGSSGIQFLNSAAAFQTQDGSYLKNSELKLKNASIDNTQLSFLSSLSTQDVRKLISVTGVIPKNELFNSSHVYETGISSENKYLYAFYLPHLIQHSGTASCSYWNGTTWVNISGGVDASSFITVNNVTYSTVSALLGSGAVYRDASGTNDGDTTVDIIHNAYVLPDNATTLSSQYITVFISEHAGYGFPPGDDPHSRNLYLSLLLWVS